MLTFSVEAQHDSGYVIQFSAGTAYLDLFRQRTSNSRTILFSKGSFAMLSAVSERETIAVSFRASEHYAAVNQQRSKIIFSNSLALQTAGVHYANTCSFFNVALNAALPINAPSTTLHYGIGIGIDPFSGLLDAAFNVQRAPVQYATSITFQDFVVPLRDIPAVTTLSYTIRSKPLSNLRTEIEYRESDGNDHDASNPYGLEMEYHSFGKKIMMEYSRSKSFVLSAEIETNEYRTGLTLNSNDQSFGNLQNGWGKYSRYSAGIRTDAFDHPVLAQYSFGQLFVEGLGEFESWPFTSLAASIISNRLNYQLSGTIKHHSFVSSTAFHLGTSTLSTTVSYHRILPDAGIEHWEPEFLVFGRKNFTRTSFSIRDIHAVGIGLQYQLPFDQFSLTADFDQFIPLSITYTSPSMAAPAPPGVSSPASPSPSTDGGRRGGINLTYTF